MLGTMDDTQWTMVNGYWLFVIGLWSMVNCQLSSKSDRLLNNFYQLLICAQIPLKPYYFYIHKLKKRNDYCIKY